MIGAILAGVLAQAVVAPPPVDVSTLATQAQLQSATANAQTAQAQANAAMAMAQAAAAKAAGAVQTVNGVSPTGAGNVAIAIPAAPDLSPYLLKSQAPAAVDLTGYATTSAMSAAITAATSSLAKAADLAATASIASAASSSASAAGLAAATAQATANAACKATPSVPPVELVGGSTGSSGTSCRPYDATQPRITRAAVVMTDSGGSWSVTWSTQLPVTPAILPLPINATSEPIVCNVATRTTSMAAGRCWYARMLPATITVLTNLVNFDVFGASAANIAVQVLAIPPTQ